MDVVGSEIGELAAAAKLGDIDGGDYCRLYISYDGITELILPITEEEYYNCRETILASELWQLCVAP